MSVYNSGGEYGKPLEKPRKLSTVPRDVSTLLVITELHDYRRVRLVTIPSAALAESGTTNVEF